MGEKGNGPATATAPGTGQTGSATGTPPPSARGVPSTAPIGGAVGVFGGVGGPPAGGTGVSGPPPGAAGAPANGPPMGQHDPALVNPWANKSEPDNADPKNPPPGWTYVPFDKWGNQTGWQPVGADPNNPPDGWRFTHGNFGEYWEYTGR